MTRRLISLVFVAAFLVAVMFPAQAKVSKTGTYWAHGTVVSQADSTLKLNVRGDLVILKIAPGLLPLIGAKGDSVHLLVTPIDTTKGVYRVKYVVKRVVGKVLYARRNLQEDFHVVRLEGLGKNIMTTWADSTWQSLGDPREWLGRQEDWREVWVVPREWEVLDEYRGVILKGDFIGYIF